MCGAFRQLSGPFGQLSGASMSARCLQALSVQYRVLDGPLNNPRPNRPQLSTFKQPHIHLQSVVFIVFVLSFLLTCRHPQEPPRPKRLLGARSKSRPPQTPLHNQIQMSRAPTLSGPPPIIGKDQFRQKSQAVHLQIRRSNLRVSLVQRKKSE